MACLSFGLSVTANAALQDNETCLVQTGALVQASLCFSILQASYLVGVSDPNSQSGHEGLVDPIQFARAHQAIQMACQNLVDPASSPSQVRLRGWEMRI